MTTSSVGTPVIPQAPNNITELPVPVQGRIFSYLDPREQGAVYTTNHRGNDSLCNDYPMSRQGWTPGNAIPQLPPSLLLQVTSYLPNNARMKETSHTMCNFLSRYEVKWLQQNPMISWIIPITPSIDQRTDCRQILSDLALLFHFIHNRYAWEPHQNLDGMRASMNRLPLPTILTSPPIDYDDAVSGLHIVNSNLLVKPNMNYHWFDQDVYDTLTAFHLIKGNREEFYTYLPKSSFPSGDSFNDPDAGITELLLIAVKENYEDIFINLLCNYKLDSANRLLDSLTKNPKIPSKYIEHLLRSQQPIDSDYCIWGPQGIHEALFHTAVTKNMSAFKAILAARPGEAIDRRILDEIKDRFSPDFPVVDYPQRQIITNYPDEASRQEMFTFIDTEIQTRYPQTTREVILDALKELPLEENSSDDEVEPVVPNADLPEGDDVEPVAPNADLPEGDDVEPEEVMTDMPIRGPSDAFDISCALM